MRYDHAASVMPSRRAPLHDLVRVYGYYRLMLSGLLLILFLLQDQNALYGAERPTLYLSTGAAYIALSTASVLWRWWHPTASSTGTLIGLVVDVCALTLLAHASGGMQSGISMLMAIAVAAASVALNRQLALLVAALATLGALIETSSRTLLGNAPIGLYFPAGLLGILFFGTAYAVRELASRTSSSLLLAEQSAENAARLQELNELIVQRLRTGIIVLGPDGAPKLSNSAARQLLGMQESDPSLPAEFTARWEQWLSTQVNQAEAFRVSPEHPEIRISFTALHGNEQETLGFLEDTRQLHQQAQQIKLASLGRLTASIAHEIRNPLGAIAHASQLLLESTTLEPADRRLGDIVLNHARRLNGVIESVLSLSRRSAAHPERINLHTWLADFCQDYRPILPAGAQIDVDITPPTLAVSFDSGHLSQILINLCQNGLRHGERCTGIPHLLLHGEETTSGIALDVIDDGPGIPESAMANLFEPFFTTEAQGTGLGLYIARELCQANQARLDYLRTSEGKSCFRISFPHPDRRHLQSH